MKKFISVAFCTLMLLSATVEAQKLETIAFQQDKISFYFFQNFQEFISETGLNEQLNNELNSLFDDQVLDPQKEFESLFSDIYDNISTIKGSAEVEFAYPDSDDEKTGEAIAQTFYEQAYKKFEEGQASLVVGLNKAGVLQLFCFISQDIACSNLLHVAHNLLILNSSNNLIPFLKSISVLIKSKTNNSEVVIYLPTGAVLLKGALKKEYLNADGWVTKFNIEEKGYCFNISIDKLTKLSC